MSLDVSKVRESLSASISRSEPNSSFINEEGNEAACDHAGVVKNTATKLGITMRNTWDLKFIRLRDLNEE
jgi:hypothetical protein